jgi:hypothetical protein
MKKHLSLVAGLALVAGLSTAAQAQVDPGTATGASPVSLNTYVTVTVPTILKLSIADTSTAVAAPDETHFDAGFQDVASAVSATVKSNKPYALSINGGASTWTGTGGARANKPVGDLLWGTGTPSTALTTTAAAIVPLTSTGTSGATSTVNYRITWGYTNDTPGTYTIPVVYTLTAP